MKYNKNYFKFAYIISCILEKLYYDIPLTYLEYCFLNVVDEYDFLIERYEQYLKKKGDK